MGDHPPFRSVDTSFRASGSGSESFCSGTEGCTIYGYYTELTDDDSNTDEEFGTTCQARSGTLAYEGSTTTVYEEVAVQSISVFEAQPCIEFPAGVSQSTADLLLTKLGIRQQRLAVAKLVHLLLLGAWLSTLYQVQLVWLHVSVTPYSSNDA